MKKLFFLIQTFMFFFVIFIVKNIEFVSVDFNTSNLLSNVLKITDILFILCIIISSIVIIYFQKNTNGAKKIPSKVVKIKQEKEVSLIFFATYAKDLTEIIYQAIEKKIPYGIYNATNEGYTTWYDFTKEILAEQGIECKVNPVTTEEYIEMMKVTQAKRPFNSQMSKAKLEACGIKVPEWKDGLKRYLEEAKNLEQ